MYVFDRVQESTTTTGTGNITLSGTAAAANLVRFQDAFAVGTPKIPVLIEGTSEWEVSMCTLSGTTTLVRDKVLASSNAGALVNFSAGTKQVAVVNPASRIADLIPRGRAEMMRLGMFTA